MAGPPSRLINDAAGLALTIFVTGLSAFIGSGHVGSSISGFPKNLRFPIYPTFLL